MYVQDGKFKIKLFTKLANQNSYDGARAIGHILPLLEISCYACFEF